MANAQVIHHVDCQPPVRVTSHAAIAGPTTLPALKICCISPMVAGADPAGGARSTAMRNRVAGMAPRQERERADARDLEGDASGQRPQHAVDQSRHDQRLVLRGAVQAGGRRRHDRVRRLEHPGQLAGQFTRSLACRPKRVSDERHVDVPLGRGAGKQRRRPGPDGPGFEARMGFAELLVLIQDVHELAEMSLPPVAARAFLPCSHTRLVSEQHLEGAERVQLDQLKADQAARGQRQPRQGSLSFLPGRRFEHQDRPWSAGRVHSRGKPVAVQLPQGAHLLAGMTGDVGGARSVARAPDCQQSHGFTTFSDGRGAYGKQQPGMTVQADCLRRYPRDVGICRIPGPRYTPYAQATAYPPTSAHRFVDYRATSSAEPGTRKPPAVTATARLADPR